MSHADMRPGEIRKYCTLDETGQSLMKSAMNQLQLSARLSPGAQAGAPDRRFGGE